MKSKGRFVTLWVLVTLVWMMSGAVGWAEEEAAKPQFMIIAEVEIIPEKVQTYMQARIGQAKLAVQYGFEFPYLTFVQDFRVTTVYMFHAFAQIDEAPQMFEAWNEKTGGKSKQLEKQAMSCGDRISTWIHVARPDLSYMPKEPAFVPDFSKPCYMSAVLYHIKPDKFEEAEAVSKKIKELNEKSQSPMAYFMEESIFGADCSALIGVAFAKDKADFVELGKKMDANPNPEIEKLFADNIHVLKRIENREGTFVPEASYVPAGTFRQP